jgi:SAM-dependent methyltransferase
VTALPYDDSSFTIVVTRYAFHHFLDPLAVLQKMVRVCAPGGRVVVVDVCASEDLAKAAEFNRLERLRNPSHARNLSLTELKDCLTTVGLPEPQMTSYELRGEVASPLARSFPDPGDDLKIVEMFKASAVDGRLGIPVQVDGEKIHYTYPVSILAAQRPRQ